MNASTAVNERVIKTARVELKTSDSAKDTLKQAAAVIGLDLSSFILSAAVEQAERVLDRQRRRELSDAEWDRLNEVLSSKAEPTSALVELMRGYNSNGYKLSARRRKNGES